MRLLPTVPLLVLPLLAAAAGPAPDRVVRRRAPPLAGVEIVSEDYKAVVVREKGGERTTRIPAEEVLEVSRDDAPAPFREGKAALQSGDLVNAVASLRLAASQASDRPWVPEYSSFHLGEAYRLSGKYGSAVNAYQKVLEVKPDSRFLPRVRMGIARAHAAAGRHDEAAQALDAFATEVDEKRLPVTWKVEANLLVARNLEGQGRPGEAATRYAAVAREAERLAKDAGSEAVRVELQDLAMRAAADRGSALVAAGDLGAADRVFQGLARRDDPHARLLGEIGQGEVHYGRGEHDKARVVLTRAAALHFEAAEHKPRALLLLARTYKALDEKGEKGARQMARIYLKDLVELHPASERVQEARELLRELG